MVSMRVEEEARAKINLDLLVTGRRPDGYHELDSIVVFAPAIDRITAEPARGLSLEVTGPGAGSVPVGPDNLVLRAAMALAAAAGIRPEARLVLEKRLPVAAGLGGGSADAAATLRALSRLWRLDLPDGQLEKLALPLGADLPACLRSRPLRLRGIGERLEPLAGLPALPLLLVNPGVPVATPAVFRRLVLAEPPPIRPPWPSVPSLATLMRLLAESRNDLEPPALALAPVIGRVLERLRALPGCRLARMSGSGATCWGLFDDPDALAGAVATLGRAQPGWWIAPAPVVAVP